MVEELDGVARHFGGGVAHERLGGLAHAAVVEDEDAVLGARGVPEVFGLPLPGEVRGAEAHDPLGGVLVRGLKGAAGRGEETRRA